MNHQHSCNCASSPTLSHSSRGIELDSVSNGWGMEAGAKTESPVQTDRSLADRETNPQPLGFSVVICAYNEEANIGGMLRAVASQRGPSFQVREIIVVASGCTDRTVDIVGSVAREDPRITAIIQPTREGKVAALRVGLGKASAEIVVVENADTLPAPGAFEEAAHGFEDRTVQLVCFHPVPAERIRSFTRSMSITLWGLHHEVSMLAPKPGEAYAIRRESTRFLTGFEDDDWLIGALVRNSTVKGVYAPRAVVYNRVPGTIRELVMQRSRIIGQGYRLRSTKGLTTATGDPRIMVRALINELKARHRDLLPLAGLVSVEVAARLWARASSARSGSSAPVWTRLETTKGGISQSLRPGETAPGPKEFEESRAERPRVT